MMGLVVKIQLLQISMIPTFSKFVSRPALRPVLKFFFAGIPFLFFACDDSANNGLVTGYNGKPVAGVAVQLLSVDDKGNTLTVIDQAITDGNGKFSFNLAGEPRASLVLQAATDSGNVKGFFAGGHGSIPVHPYTTSLVNIIQNITRTEGQRTTSDFTAGELRDLTQDAMDELTASLDDATAVTAELKEKLGRSISKAAGGTLSVNTDPDLGDSTLSSVSMTADTSICGIGSIFHLLDGQDFRFDIEEDGTVCGGVSASLPSIFNEGAFELHISDRTFYLYGGESFPMTGLSTVSLEGEREISLSERSLVKLNTPDSDPPYEDTLKISRKIYVPEGKDWVRYLDIFNNTGTKNQTINVGIRTFLTTNNESELLVENANYIAAYDNSQNRPTAGFIFQDGSGTEPPTALFAPGVAGGQVNEVQYKWETLTIPKGKKVILLHYGVLTASRDSAEVESLLSDLTESPDMSGMSLEELSSLVNFSPRIGTVNGEAGSVTGGATVTATNGKTGKTMSVIALEDGSFHIPLTVSAGDAITVTATDGLSESIP